MFGGWFFQVRCKNDIQLRFLNHWWSSWQNLRSFINLIAYILCFVNRYVYRELVQPEVQGLFYLLWKICEVSFCVDPVQNKSTDSTEVKVWLSDSTCLIWIAAFKHFLESRLDSLFISLTKETSNSWLLIYNLSMGYNPTPCEPR